MKQIGELVKKHRKSLGLTQKELARVMGLDQTSISRIERGETDITVSQLREFEKLLNVSLYSAASRETTDLFGLETLYELSVLHNRTEYEEMIEIIKKAEAAEYFKIPNHRNRLMYWQAKALATTQVVKAQHILESILDSTEIRTDHNLLSLVYLDLGRCLQEQDKFNAARECYEQALKLQGTHPSLQFDAGFMSKLYYGLAAVHISLNNLDNGEMYLIKATKFTEDSMLTGIHRHLSVLYTRASVLVIKESYDTALEIFNYLLQQYQQYSMMASVLSVLNNIAFTLKCMGNDKEAHEKYEHLVELARKNPQKVRSILRRELEKEGYFI